MERMNEWMDGWKSLDKINFLRFSLFKFIKDAGVATEFVGNFPQIFHKAF
jgi:hypothetical protein